MNSNIFKAIHEFALSNSQMDDIHGFPHLERVFDLCMQIGTKLKANLKVLKVAALFHDIGRSKKDYTTTERHHADISADLAHNFLNSQEFGFSKEDIKNIIHCIQSHSFSNHKKPKTLEAQILSDADKLDAIGAIGLYRTIGFTIKNNGNLNDVIKHLEEKIIKLKDMLLLDISRKIAEKRHKIVLDFYQQIKIEANLD